MSKKKVKGLGVKFDPGGYEGFAELEELGDGLFELDCAIRDLVALRKRIKKRGGAANIVESLAEALLAKTFEEKAHMYIDKYSKDGDVIVSFRWHDMGVEYHGSLKEEVADFVDGIRGEDSAAENARVLRDCFLGLAAMLDELLKP